MNNKKLTIKRWLPKLLLLALYVGVAIPGWIIATSYVPNTPVEQERAPITATATSSRLYDLWETEATVQWADQKNIRVAADSLSLLAGDVIRPGDVVIADRAKPLFAIACDVPAIEVYPDEPGGQFLKCVHNELKRAGFQISDVEMAEGVIETSTKEALQQYYISRRSSAPKISGSWKTGDTTASLKQQFVENRIKIREYIDRRSETLSQEGEYIDRNHWMVIPKGTQPTVVDIDYERNSMALGFGGLEAVAQLPAAVMEASQKVFSYGQDQIFDTYEFGDPELNPESGVTETRVVFQVPLGAALLPNQLIDVQLQANDTAKDVISVPVGAVETGNDSNTVTVVSGETTKEIQLGELQRIGGRVVIPAGLGLTAGDQVRLG